MWTQYLCLRGLRSIKSGSLSCTTSCTYEAVHHDGSSTMMTSSIFDFHPPVCGARDNGRRLLAKAHAHALGITEPTLLKILAVIMLEHPEWTAKRSHLAPKYAHSELLEGVIATNEP